MIINVHVTCNKQSFDVQLDTDEDVSYFKSQIYSLTNVPPERQKIMVKGHIGVIKDDDKWSNIKGVSEGAKISILGTADVLAAKSDAPVAAASSTEPAKEIITYAPGFRNLGNTCYLNATLQCLHAVPELGVALSQLKDTNDDPAGRNVSLALREVWKSLDNKTLSEITPIRMLMAFRMAYPQFDAKDDHGNHMQQDADEALVHLFRSLNIYTKPLPQVNGTCDTSAVSQLFRGELVTKSKCIEGDATEQITVQPFEKLSCFIDQTVNIIDVGVLKGLEGEVTKYSPQLNRDSVFTTESRISVPPRYLVVNFVRFSWKSEKNLRAKILRPVKYPLEFDIYSFCTPELKARIDKYRDVFRNKEEQIMEAIKNKTVGNAPDTEIPKLDLWQLSTPEGKLNDLVDSGWYELVGVVGHQGRSAEGGHYLAWIKSKKEGEFIKYDDETLTSVKAEDVLALAGGGDSPIAYVLFYRMRDVPTKIKSTDITNKKSRTS